MLKKININVYFKHINMKNYHKIIISFFLLFIHLSIFSQVDKFSFGLYCNAKFHYYPDDMKYLNDWFKYKYKFKNTYELGYEFAFYRDKINKHIGVLYAPEFLKVKYIYNTYIADADKDKLVGSEEYNFERIMLSLGVSKSLHISNKFSFNPYVGVALPLLYNLSSTKTYAISGKQLERVDMANIIYQLRGAPYIKINLNIFYSPAKHFAIQIAPFAQTYFDISFSLLDDNINRMRFAPRYSYGVSLYLLYFNF